MTTLVQSQRTVLIGGGGNQTVLIFQPSSGGGSGAIGNALLTSQSTTITDSRVSATSTIQLTLQAVGDLYMIGVLSVANGSFVVQCAAPPTSGDRVNYTIG